MAKVKLDHTLCLLAHCAEGKKKTDYWDEVTSGFVLEARAAATTVRNNHAIN